MNCKIKTKIDLKINYMRIIRKSIYNVARDCKIIHRKEMKKNRRFTSLRLNSNSSTKCECQWPLNALFN